MTKEEFEKKVYANIPDDSDGILVAQIIQKLSLSDDDKEVVAKCYGFDQWNKGWKILEKIEGLSIIGDSDSKKVLKRKAVEASSPSASQLKKINIRERIAKLLSLLNSGLYEKEETVRLALLSAIAGESIFFLGPPGTAKSMISSRIHHAFKEGTKYFEYLMNEFSTPDEIFGSVKLKGLDEGVYEKNTNGYLPEANVAFLDEIWKSGPAILNTLLTIINEKKFRNGDKVVKVPLQVLLAASNELPKEKSGLEALYDRFIIRTMVNPVSMENEESFFDLCEKSGKELIIPEDIKPKLLSIGEVQGWSEKINEIKLSATIKEVIMEIRRELEVKNQEKNREEKEKFYVSDRRWKKIIHLLKTSAFLCDREEVDLMDLQLITYCIWNTPKQREEVKSIVKEIVQEHGLECTTAIDDIEQQIKVFEKYIDETFYQESKEEPKLYKMQDGHSAYKLISPLNIRSYDNQQIELFYISEKDVHKCYDRIGAYYDDNKEVIGDRDYCIYQNSFTLDNENSSIEWDDWYMRKYYANNYKNTAEIEMTKGGLKKKTELFNNSNILNPVLVDCERIHYLPIANSIEKELKNLDDFRSKIEKPYDENLFADKSFKEVITSKIEEEKKKLEDAKLELDKQKNRYEK